MAFAKTGVKFVHHEAEKYDLGIYFEVREGAREGGGERGREGGSFTAVFHRNSL